MVNWLEVCSAGCSGVSRSGGGTFVAGVRVGDQRCGGCREGGQGLAGVGVEACIGVGFP